jgi:hypothetical protein
VLLQGDGAIALSVRYYYRIVRVEGRRPWQAETAAYYYTFLDNHGREIIGYHWHPTTPDVTFPHLHVEPGAVRMDILERAGLPPTSNALRVDITAAHFPTHQVTPEEMVRLAIAQFRVRPRRSDWEAVLRTRPR